MAVWRNFHGHEVGRSIEEVLRSDFHRLREQGYDIRLCVGTDSHVHGDWIQFATVLVVIVKGNGGFMYVKKHRVRGSMSLRERIMTEIAYSIEAAGEIQGFVEQYNIALEIHADVNQNPLFPSHVSYHDALGYIVGMGYRFVSKPDAFASSVCADRFCH
ncbi:MAG: ribonuclease H-like YkuK family protein [Flavobacteriales bacterium]|nr:ribonuclease H-like YkuK family protein [Flavobacteriales bacterium]MCX7768567.1 ribonuclease H-like YkuK family protein [Flavobacteriales bacterium]MDW8409464.1 ribonuclease H-like YkuK family protein [Flavobacteriales bacterium]